MKGNTKSKLNLIIDILMFISLSAMAGIGFLMKFVLVRGEIRNIIYGNNIDLEFFGLTRHEWGSIHLIISIIFIALLVLHIILHWKLIVSFFKCLFSRRFIRYGVVTIICLFGLVTLISPFIVEPEKVLFEPQHRNRINNISTSDSIHLKTMDHEVITIQQSAVSEKPDSSAEIQESPALVTHEDHHNSEYREFEVYGYHTIQYVADRYNVPAAIICRDLNIPENMAGERLGRLRKQYDFTMTDVRKSISEYKKHHQ